MIINHFATLYFLFGVTCTLLVLLIALWIATKVMERKIKKMRDEDADHCSFGERRVDHETD